MPRRLPRLALALVSLLALAACVVNLAYDMKKTLQVDAAGTSIAQTQTINLADYPEVQQHKSNIKSLSFDSADAVVTAVATSNHATVVNGSMSLRPAAATDASHDVLVGNLTNVHISQGATFHLAGSPALDTFLFNELQSDGSFKVIVSGTTDGEAHFTLDLTMHASMAYDAGIL